MNAFEARTAAPSPSGQREEITVGKTFAFTGDGKEAEVFTMTLGDETINLFPLRNWSQLDVYKWRAQGKVPGTPAGLEITFDHIKVAGETVSNKDPEGTAKLQKLLNEWLVSARGSLELTLQTAHPKWLPVEQEASVRAANQLPHFRVEVDKEGQVHIKCHRGKETLAVIGLSLAGLNGLVNQGLMHRPHSVQVGALHDWVELDGELFSFENGNNDASKLEKALNERYLSMAAFGQGQEVVVFANVASSTGFDIQFAARVGGVIDNRRRPLNEETLGLLQNTDRCDLLPKDLLIKLSPPNLIFKRKTPDGGERYLDEGPEAVVTVVGDEGETTMIDLSRPVNYLRLTAMELTAVFNHPTINQHRRALSQRGDTNEKPKPAQVVVPTAAERPVMPFLTVSQPKPEARPGEVPQPKPTSPKPGGGEPIVRPAPVVKPLPNLWLEAILTHPAIRHDWFTRLIYRKMAEHFGNSCESMFGPIPCWASSLGEVDDICDPAFRGVFLTQKGGLAYLSQGHIARFNNRVAFVGTLESTIEGIGVNLKAVGADSQQRIVFIVTGGYRTQFGLPEQAVAEELARLREYGALMLSTNEVLQSPEPLELAWTVPAEHEHSSDPQAVEHLRPAGQGQTEASAAVCGTGPPSPPPSLLSE
jgi:hypothetical protein